MRVNVDGDVGVKVFVSVAVLVAVLVGVKVSGVAVYVDDAAIVGVEVTVGVSAGGVFPGMKIKAKRRSNPATAGIPYLTTGREMSAFL